MNPIRKSGREWLYLAFGIVIILTLAEYFGLHFLGLNLDHTGNEVLMWVLLGLNSVLVYGGLAIRNRRVQNASHPSEVNTKKSEIA